MSIATLAVVLLWAIQSGRAAECVADGLTLNQAQCTCGSDSMCARMEAQYCHGTICSSSPICSNTNGTIKNIQGPCMCGTNELCARMSEEYCFADTNYCTTAEPCSNTDGTEINPRGSCICGTQHPNCAQAQDEYCFADINLCTSTEPCENGDGTNKNPRGPCMCGTNPNCAEMQAEYCYSGTNFCTVTDPECIHKNGTKVNAGDCACGSATSGGSSLCTTQTGRFCHAETSTCSKLCSGDDCPGYVVLQKGTCVSEGYQEIMDAATCWKAGAIHQAGSPAVDGLGTADYDRKEISSNLDIKGCYAQMLTTKGGPYTVFNTPQPTDVTFFCTFANRCLCLKASTPCAITNGSSANEAASCKCGTAICDASTGMHCLAQDNRCGFGPRCSKMYMHDSDPSLMQPNDEDCICGTGKNGLDIKDCTSAGRGRFCIQKQTSFQTYLQTSFHCYRTPPTIQCPISDWSLGGEYAVPFSCTMGTRANNFEGVLLKGTDSSTAIELSLSGPSPSNKSHLSKDPNDGSMAGAKMFVVQNYAVLNLKNLILSWGKALQSNMCDGLEKTKNHVRTNAVSIDTGQKSSLAYPEWDQARGCLGGAVLVYGTAARFTAQHVDFTNNEAFAGGALWASTFFSVDLDHCLFENNTSYENGGAISLEYVPKAPKVTKIIDFSHGAGPQGKGFRLSSSTFRSNQAMVSGGGFNIMGDLSTGFTFMDEFNSFTNNYAVRGSGRQIQTDPLMFFRWSGCPAGTFTTSLQQLSASDNFVGCPFLCHQGKYSKETVALRYDKCDYTCPSGSYCPSGSALPIPCAGGKYGGVDGESLASSCKTCPKGFWSDAKSHETAAECVHCPMGYYQHEAAKAFCLSCVAGQYQDQVNATSCIKCSSGHTFNTSIVVGTSAADCLACEEGQYQPNEGSTFCLPCLTGTFQNEPGSSTCKDCPIGFSNGDTEQSSCINCTVGMYQDETVQANCKDCDAGFYSAKVGAVSRSVCIGCPQGRYSSATGLSSPQDCNKCAAGKKNANVGSNSSDVCNDCDANTKAAVEGSSECLPCSVGLSSEKGSAKCQACGAGRYGDECQACTKGQYRNGTDPIATSCRDCPSGHYTSDVGQGSCLPCIPGRYNDLAGASQCKSCAEDHYGDNTARSNACKKCAPGRTSVPASTKCSECGSGQYEKSRDLGCVKCPIGYSQPEQSMTQCLMCGPTNVLDVGKGSTTETSGSPNCIRCEYGKFGVGNECLDCDYGKYQDSKGELTCKNCLANTWSNVKAATAASQCISCDTDKTTGNTTGAINSSQCVCQRGNYYQNGAECVACTIGANCSRSDGVDVSGIYGQPGYWRPNRQTDVFVNCKAVYGGAPNADTLAKERCCSNCENQTNATEWNSDGQCATGYQGVLCGGCAEEYVRQGQTCTFCPGGSSLSAAFGVAIGLVFGIFVVTVLFLLIAKSENAVEDGSALFDQAKIMLSFVQIMSSMPQVFDGVPWPENFVNFAFPFVAINLDLSLFAFSNCELSVPFFDAFLVHMSLPLMIVAAVFVAYLSVTRCCKKKEDERKKAWAQTMKMIILMILILYPGICNRIFTTFRCQSIEGVEGQVLSIEFATKCHEGKHLMFASLAVVFLFVYVLGIPFSMFLILFQNRKALHDANHPKHESIRYQFGGMYSQYDKEYWWFEIAIMMHKMVMTGALCLLSPGQPLQLMTATLVMLIYLLTILKTAPYAEDTEDWTSFVSVFALTLMTLIGFALLTDSRAVETLATNFERDLMSHLLIGIAIGCLIFELFIVVAFDCGFYEKLRGARWSQTVGHDSVTKILPILEENQSEDTLRAKQSWQVKVDR